MLGEEYFVCFVDKLIIRNADDMMGSKFLATGFMIALSCYVKPVLMLIEHLLIVHLLVSLAKGTRVAKNLGIADYGDHALHISSEDVFLMNKAVESFVKELPPICILPLKCFVLQRRSFS